MRDNKLDQLVVQLENYLECWKQFNYFLSLGRSKKFSAEDENQFLELKSVIVQELELIAARIELTSPSREDVLNLIGVVPSIRYLSECNEGVLRGVENHWHRIYVGWQSIVGQLKVKQKELEGQSRFASFFSRKK